jgi:aerobic-type carbon monoxide dehydrogenase small subunit (CoxS/CutS family)
MTIQFTVDGRQVEVPDDGASLLEVLRDRLGLRSPKDGCSPQGQCGCCTVLVDGAPRVSCVTPARRMKGRDIVTLDGLPEDEREKWVAAFTATGASQCGFCTPGIIVRLSGLRSKGVRSGPPARPQIDRALAAHLCRCTGWQTIVEAWDHYDADADTVDADRDRVAAARRAEIEGGGPQRVGPEVACGRGGFADDSAPAGALVAVPDGGGGWAVSTTLTAARQAVGKVQGRRTTADARPPLDLPPGDWAVTLRTSWVEPAFLETDASWCEPGGEPMTPLANGGAFGAKTSSPVADAARRLAEEHGRPVRVLLSREDTVRSGPKRPPIAAGVRSDGTGVVRVVRTPGIADAMTSAAPGLEVEEVDVAGPPTSVDLRAAGWAEAQVLLAGVRGDVGRVTGPAGGWAEVAVAEDGAIGVRVGAGEPLDAVVLRSYVIGAAHMALGWVTSEALAVDDDGEVHDLTIRSFGILRAADTPPVEVEIEPETGPPVNASDAAFAAVAAAVWLDRGRPGIWPTG